MISDVTGYIEHPAKGVSAVFAVLFAVSGILHTWQTIKYKSWPYMWVVPPACIIFIAGFVCREYAAHHPGSDVYSAMQGLLYSAVPIISTTSYIYLPQLLPLCSTIRPETLFIVLISLTFSTLITLTAQGAATFFDPDSTPGGIKSGLALLKASLILQLVFLVAVVLIVLASRKRAQAQGILQLDSGLFNIFNFSGFFILLLIRDIFRTVQIFMPSDSMVWTQEVFFWVFDAAPMLAYTVLLNWLHPGQHLSDMMQEERRAAAASPPPEPFDDLEVGAGGRMDKDTAIKLRPFSRESY